MNRLAWFTPLPPVTSGIARQLGEAPPDIAELGIAGLLGPLTYLRPMLLGLRERITVAGYVDDDELDDELEASDACLCLRWPTSRGTSASWLRCLAAGKPTVTTDFVHTVGVPMLDPRNWGGLHTGDDEHPATESLLGEFPAAGSPLTR